MTRTIGAIVLAAGFSTRFGGQKLIKDLPNGNGIFTQTLGRIRSAIPRVKIITRPELAKSLSIIQEELYVFKNAEKGIGATLAFGVSLANEWDGCLVCLADMPFIQTKTYQIIASSLQETGITVPLYNGKQGNPVGFGSRFFKELRKLNEDIGGISLTRKYHRNVQYIKVSDPGILKDIDTPEDIESA